MRKLLFTLPLLFLPAFAGAAHQPSLQGAAYQLEASASQFYNEVARQRGQRRLKAEARRFAVLSERFARRASYQSRSPRLARSLIRLELGYGELRAAFWHAPRKPGARRLSAKLMRVGLALNRVEDRAWRLRGFAATRSHGNDFRAAARITQRQPVLRRYRN